MDYDVIIIGAGMSGLGAGIRLAHFDRRVCIVERHDVYGGLNSFYTQAGRQFDVGLHAVTNFVTPSRRNAPLNKLLRQLRIPRESFDLCEQKYSMIAFPDRRLRFGNGIQLLVDEVGREFPKEVDNFLRLIEVIKVYDDLDYSPGSQSARELLGSYIEDRMLIDMLLCPLMFYGCATQNDMDWTPFVTMFKSVFLEGFARPRQGVRRLIAQLVKRYRECGGEFRMGCGVKRLESDGSKVIGVILDNGEQLTADQIFSSAGYHETMGMTADCEPPDPDEVGQLSFIESISLLPVKPADLGLDTTIIFFNDAETFSYARPDDLIDPRSGVICCPNNYEQHGDMKEGIIRVTSLANYDRWMALEQGDYEKAKTACYDQAIDHAVKFIPEFREQVVHRDIFTPRTIEQFTGHLNGAVYGASRKVRDGRTHLNNLFICGTDQGFLGIIGALLSGISMANLHGLSQD